MAGYDCPFLESFEVRLTLKGIARLAKHTPNRAPPITPELLVKIISVCSLEDPREVTFLSAFLFTFFLFARVSNIVPASASQFDKSKHLCRGDIFTAEGGLLVLFKWTKTIQYNERRLLLPLVPIKGSHLCPVAMFQRMCVLVPAPSHAPAFIFDFSRKGGYLSVSKNQFVSFLRSKLSLAGVTHPSLYRGHSFRRGAASFAFHCGVPGELIQVFGDWSSDAYKSYLEYSLAAKFKVASDIAATLTN